MVVGKILIDLWHFWPRRMYLLNRHLPQFSKSWYIFKKIEFKLKVSLQETPSTIPKNWIYIKCVSWKDTFHMAKNPICIKGVSCKDTFHVAKNPICIKGVSCKDTFHMTKNPICIKGVSWRDTFHNLTNLNVLWIWF